MRESQIANKLGKTGDTFSSSVYLESLMVELDPRKEEVDVCKR